MGTIRKGLGQSLQRLSFYGASVDGEDRPPQERGAVKGEARRNSGGGGNLVNKKPLLFDGKVKVKLESTVRQTRKIDHEVWGPLGEG